VEMRHAEREVVGKRVDVSGCGMKMSWECGRRVVGCVRCGERSREMG
jgi:hypothetical protein